jgi:metal-responsive CopG/Arc/MetJ family transcriptional regulator
VDQPATSDDAETQHFSVTLPRAVVHILDEVAARRGGSRSSVLREAAIQFIERQRLVSRIADAVEVA